VFRAALVAVLIAGASAVKHHHSAMKLTVADFALLRAGTLKFLVQQYRATALGILTAAGLGAVAMWLPSAIGDRGALPMTARLGVLFAAFAACAVLFRSGRQAAYFKSTISEPANFFSGFVASAFDIASWWRTGGLQFTDIAPHALALSAAVPARSPQCPDVIVIQHESVFDPRIFGLPAEPWAASFFAPPDSLSGRLHVEIFGGGSWQTEFSLLTGLASRSFGPDAYFLFQRGTGRFRHALPSQLKALGYRTVLAAACARDFVNYDAFYNSIGVDARSFTEDFPPPFDRMSFDETSSDAMFLAAASRSLENSIARDPAPHFQMVLTNFNHGPHSKRRIASGRFERERDIAYRSLPDPQYAEYYARLAETAASWTAMKARLAHRFPDRPMLVVRYGDHQPVMTRRIERALGLAPGNRRQFETFYAIEGINMRVGETLVPPDGNLDIAFLGTVALQAAGLPLDAVSATRASLIAECAADYFAAPSPRKRGFHRALAELGHVDCTPY
jgi:phosphoglycerol transferase MdoB-like AlkP superfamily enzyme